MFCLWHFLQKATCPSSISFHLNNLDSITIYSLCCLKMFFLSLLTINHLWKRVYPHFFCCVAPPSRTTLPTRHRGGQQPGSVNEEGVSVLVLERRVCVWMKFPHTWSHGSEEPTGQRVCRDQQPPTVQRQIFSKHRKNSKSYAKLRRGALSTRVFRQFAGKTMYNYY